jgi:hypothetical protein
LLADVSVHDDSTCLQMLFDSKDSEAFSALSLIHGLTLRPLLAPHADEETLDDFQSYYDAFNQWKGQPGNYLLMIKQSKEQGTSCSVLKDSTFAWKFLPHLL